MAVTRSNVATAQSGLDIDLTQWPLVLVRFPRRALTDAEIDTLLKTLSTTLRKREKHVAVLDALDIEVAIDARQRRRFTDFMQDAEMRELSRYKLADVILLRSAILRGAMTAVFWVAPPVSPTKAFGDIGEALPFIKERCREDGLAFTPAMEAALLRVRRS